MKLALFIQLTISCFSGVSILHLYSYVNTLHYIRWQTELGMGRSQAHSWPMLPHAQFSFHDGMVGVGVGGRGAEIHSSKRGTAAKIPRQLL
jgi:hypothetical protein